MGKFIDLTGQKFNRLIAIKYLSNSYWLCNCECGNIKIIRSDSLINKKTLSCGCLHKEKIKKVCKNNFYKHGKTHLRIYKIWCNMKERCKNKNNKNYGAKDIKVCIEWQNFENFYNWSMNSGYNDNLTIDRIDVNGNYEPNNCRWVTQKIQQNNRSNNTLITYKNKTLTLSQWAKLKNIKVSTLSMRINNYNWSIEKALEN